MNERLNEMHVSGGRRLLPWWLRRCRCLHGWFVGDGVKVHQLYRRACPRHGSAR